MIEIGRRNQTTKDNRHCPFCGSNLIEETRRRSSLSFSMCYKVKTLEFQILPSYPAINGLINVLMNSSNYFINLQFIEYISACFDVRDKLLSK